MIKRKKGPFIYIYYKEENRKSFIHPYRRRKEGKNKWKILKAISIKTSSSIINY